MGRRLDMLMQRVTCRSNVHVVEGLRHFLSSTDHAGPGRLMLGIAHHAQSSDGLVAWDAGINLTPDSGCGKLISGGCSKKGNYISAK